ncbi:MFS transporter, partial [Erwinia sp. B116]
MSSLTLAAHSSRWSIVAVCSAALMLPLSFSAGVIATPAIAVNPGGSPLALSWITNAFLLSFGSLLMAAGTLADRYGRKRLFMTGVSLFTLLSLLTPWLPSVVWLDAVRALQGAAAAAALAGGSAALANAFEGHAR